MRNRALAEAAAVLIGALILTAALTYPLLPKIDRIGRVNTDDGRLSIWNVAWVADALIVHPRTLFDANIFYPAKRALAFSEANIGAGVIALPAWGLTGNPYLAHNSVVVFAFLMACAGTYYLVRYLSASREAAAVAAVLFGFCPFIFARTAHIQLLMTFGLPFSMLAFHRLIDRPGVARAVVLGLVLWAQALSCAYYGIFAGLMVGLGTLFFAATRGLWRSPRYWLLVAVAAAVALGLTAPFFLPYLEVQQDGFARTLDDSRQYSANAGAWLASSAWAHRWWLPYIEGFSEVLFPGIILTVLGVAGAWLGLRGGGGVPPAAGGPRPPGLVRDVAAFYVLVAVLAFWLSFGPDAGLYTVFFDTVPVFAFLRAPSRMGLMVALSFTVLSSVVLGPWLRARRRTVAWTTALVLLAALELNGAPLTALRDAPPVPEAYRALARLPRGPVAEFPYFYRRSDFPRHAEYMLGSTIHFQPLINGYSDHIPAEFRATVVPLSSFPTREAFGILGRIGARYVVFHLNGYDRRSRERLLQRLQDYQRYLRPLVQQDDVWLFEIVDWPN
ncbi:MAG: hypothetical protein IT181_17915 [Acidobacteria bacterium]|nr:hypothetical protein [Acidobacteriota bacterium]